MVFKKGGIPTCSHTGVLNKPNSEHQWRPFKTNRQYFSFPKIFADFRRISGQFVLSDIVIFGTCQTRDHKQNIIQLRVNYPYLNCEHFYGSFQ